MAQAVKANLSDAENVLDEALLDYGTKVGGFISNSIPLVLRYRMATQIIEIRKRLDKVASDRHKFCIQIIDLHTHVVHKSEMIYSTMSDSDVIGMEHDKEKIIQILMQPSTCDGDLSLPVIPIVGMGGLSKTTLLKFVFSDKRIDESFSLKMWVCVSDVFDIKQVIIEMINFASADAPTHQQNLKELDLEQVLNHLRKKFANQKFLLILDDICNEDHNKWVELRNLLHVGRIGSKILVTTCSHFTTSMMGTAPSRYLYLDEWESVRENLPQNKDDILLALKLRYAQMPSYLRQCFALFSLYPRDFVFQNSEVTSLWAALGLLPSPKDNESFTDVANQCLYDLKSRFFLQDFVNFSTSCYFTIHDSVHNLAFSVAKDECLMVNSNIQKTPEYVQHLSFAENGFLGKSFTPSYLGVRTILFPIEGMGASSKDFLNMCVSSYKYLRILDLSDSTYETLPRSVGKLIHLRFLSLERNEKIKRIPDSISQLPHLQVLDLSGCTKLQTLPKGLRYLTSLQQLGITTKQSVLPENDIANMSYLEILNIKSCDNLESLFVGIKLPTLKTLTVTNCGSLKSLPFDINQFPQLETLLVDNCGNLELSKGHDDQSSNLRLKAIHLQSLQQLVTLPHWLQESADTLQSLLIVDCKNFEVLPEWLSTLSFLKSFCISDCPKLMFLPNDIHCLTAVGYLRIEGCPKLCRKLQPLVGEYWSKISHIKQIFIDEPEDPEKKW